jgi:GT2 family glycosyltransferase
VYVPYLSHAGASGLGVRKTIHEQVGGFDERFIYCEDADYCWKIQLAGHPLHFEHRALIYVYDRNTSSGQFMQAVHWGEYSVLLIKKYIHKGMPKPRVSDGLKQWRPLIGILRRLGRGVSRKRFTWELGYRSWASYRLNTFSNPGVVIRARGTASPRFRRSEGIGVGGDAIVITIGDDVKIGPTRS